MIVTGIAHLPARLHERTSLPSTELVYLAMRTLRQYQAAHLITSLAWGWEQALAIAAGELEIPYTAALPYSGREDHWPRASRVAYNDLLARAKEVILLSDGDSNTAVMAGHRWRIDRAGLVLALWDYEFSSDTFATIQYAVRSQKTVVNLWQDWDSLYSLRKAVFPVAFQNAGRGAQVFERK
jgi:hypothetical protein